MEVEAHDTMTRGAAGTGDLTDFSPSPQHLEREIYVNIIGHPKA